MAIQQINRGTQGDPSDRFTAGSAFDTAQENDDYLDAANTVAALALLSLSIGDAKRTKGCISIGDGGHGQFIVEAASGTPDGYSRVLLANGNHAVLQAVNNCYSVKQFGAVGDGVTSSRFAIIRAIAFMKIMSATAACNMHVPSGTYLVDSSNGTTFPSGGRSCFVFDEFDNWSFFGDGKYKTTFLYDPADDRGSRVFDINLCSKFLFKGIGIVGAREPFITPPATSPSGTDGFVDRCLNPTVMDFGYFDDIYMHNSAMYGMGLERGPYTNCIFSDIVIGWTGNDGIDMKSNDVDEVYTQDINKNNLFEDIVGLNFGSLVYEAPNVLLDMRCGNSIARRITAYNMHPENVVVRTVSGINNSLFDVTAYGTDNSGGENQIGIIVASPNVKIYSPRLFNMYIGIQTLFNTQDGRNPSFEVFGATIESCTIPIDAIVGPYSKVFGGHIKDADYRGIRTGSYMFIDGVTFEDCAEAIRFETGTTGTVVANCRKVSGGGIAYSGGSATADVNTVVNCGDLSTDYKMDFIGRNMLLNGTQVLTSRKTGWTAATGTATRTTYATGSVTLPQLAERVKALTDDLISHGIIGS